MIKKLSIVGMSIEQIAEIVSLSVDEVKQLIENNQYIKLNF